MRAGNGRHRRPRQAPALLVTAGVTGAGIAMPLLGATSAQAADAGIWDRVAECESGGLWSANEQNGHYGGLQLSLETWQGYGGTAYAPRPDLASRSQQISVAERVLDDRGPDAWSSCAERSGLTDEQTRDPEVTPGDEAEQDDSTGDRTQPSPGDTASPVPDDEPDGSDRDRSSDNGSHRGTPEPSETPAAPGEGSGKHRKSPENGAGSNTPGTPGSPVNPDESSDTSAPDDRSGRDTGHADRGERADGPGHPSRDGGPGGRGHEVRAGDSLSAIAERHQVEGGWPELYERNRQVVGSDPDLIRPGQHLSF
ncbi:transglycosylase family protein [Streptomyces sulphureus]|uniref:transglycosylase family protein n=1 Tax=Streptomyces sulphureus TaxID=47758 RepID=UPI000476D3A4|nr:transglycosylase family protein [Streptomyces sulphureus]